MLLEGKSIIVTGASQGLGEAIAAMCVAAGGNVVLAAPSLEELEAVANRIAGDGGQAHAVRCDVTRMEDLERVVQEAVARFGRVDGLVNNAGINFVKPLLETTQADWDTIMAVDLKGSFFLTQLCARRMVEQGGGGSIVQIGSVHTVAALPGAGPYDAAKHGVVGYSKAAAVELAPHRIRVNVLSPGLCRTGIWADIVAAAPSERQCVDFWNANIPAQRLIEPHEIGSAAVFLLSDMASAITGANLLADLGMTSQLVSRERYQAAPIEVGGSATAA